MKRKKCKYCGIIGLVSSDQIKCFAEKCGKKAALEEIKK